MVFFFQSVDEGGRYGGVQSQVMLCDVMRCCMICFVIGHGGVSRGADV
jgi:hypothetical protein